MKKKLLSLLVLLMTAATGAMAQEPTTYKVTLQEGTEDATNWTIPEEAAEGATVTATYTGKLKVKSVKAVKKAGALATPLTIEAITAGTISVSSPKEGMQYSLDGGVTKTTMTANPTTINVAAGDKVQFYGKGTTITGYDGTKILGNGDGFTCKVYGNIMSLVDETGFATAKTLSANPTFYRLFAQNTMLTDASGLLLPATELASYCYSQMFRDCTSLTAAPELPATELASNCYRSMFMGCTALTTAPVLLATTLVEYCYYQMFTNCSKLATVTCLAESGINTSNSTYNWLNGAGTDVQGTKTVYTVSTANWPMNNNSGIPEGWTRMNPDGTVWVDPLTVPMTIEALSAGTIVVQDPKSGMQYTLNGGAKTAVTSDAINVAAGDKVAFYGNGTSITSYEGTKIYGGTADYNLYGNIMSLVDEENFATATTLTATYAFNRLFSSGVGDIYNTSLKDASGLLLPATTLTKNCYSSMFWGCTSLTAAPALPATTMKESCYYGMFEKCTSLTAAPTLPATTLAPSCYFNMFLYCTGLTDAPALPATTMYNSCYRQMFSGCTSLTTAPALPATTLINYCYNGMFKGCTSLTTAPVLPATTLINYCYEDMFKNCSNLASVTCLATNISAKNCVIDWLLNAGSAVQGTKTFYKAASMTGWGTNIPSGWTVENAPNN